MATDIVVPTLGESVSEATIGRWFKKPGDAVAADEPLVELETDKVTLAGALTVADTLDPATAEALRTAAAHAFDAGVGITAVIGAVLVGIAAVIAATTLKGSRTAHAEH